MYFPLSKKDYRKKIIFSPDDFDEKGHLLQVVTIPANTRQRSYSHEVQTEVFSILEGEPTITVNEVDYPARPSVCAARDCPSKCDRGSEVVAGGGS